MRHACRQQADAAQLVGLYQALFQFGAVGHVVEDDQPPDLLLLLRNQGRDGDVQRGLAEQRRQRQAVTAVAVLPVRALPLAPLPLAAPWITPGAAGLSTNL